MLLFDEMKNWLVRAFIVLISFLCFTICSISVSANSINYKQGYRNDSSFNLKITEEINVVACQNLKSTKKGVPFTCKIESDLVDYRNWGTSAAQVVAKGRRNLVIQFGKTENQIYHAFRHIDELGLDKSLVQTTIQNHFKTVSTQVVAGKPFNQIIEIGGQRLQYSVFKLSDGTFNIGRIHGVK